LSGPNSFSSGVEVVSGSARNASPTDASDASHSVPFEPAPFHGLLRSPEFSEPGQRSDDR
jgi:hypothetical protein